MDDDRRIPDTRSPRDQRAADIVRKRYGTPAGCQVGYPVGTSITAATVTFARAEVNATYGVIVEPSWLTTHRVTGKTTSQFVVGFGTASGTADTISFTTFRDDTA